MTKDGLRQEPSNKEGSSLAVPIQALRRSSLLPLAHLWAPHKDYRTARLKNRHLSSLADAFGQSVEVGVEAHDPFDAAPFHKRQGCAVCEA